VDIETKQFWEMGLAEQIRKEHGAGGNDSQFDAVTRDIKAIAHHCKNYVWHSALSADTVKRLKKEGFSVEFENGCYTISW
jgi:hypothetical protein